jgi:Mg-chelatase subunit ChlD
MKLDNMNFGNLGNEITLRKTELEAKPSLLKKLDAVYDEHARLLFLFDTSGSMGSRVATDKHGKTFVDQFVWDAKQLAQIRADIAAAIARLNGAMIDPFAAQPGDEEFAPLADKVPGPNGEFMFTPDDEDLKARIVRADMITLFQIPIDFSKKHQQPPMRMELVKKLAKQEIAGRFKKFPNALISVVPFSNHPVTLFDCQDPDNLWPALEGLSTSWQAFLCPACGKVKPINSPTEVCDCGAKMKHEGSDGGTDILAAIRRAMDLCRAKPSPVGIHHIILVTDGEDGQADQNIGAWVPSLQASGVVLDYIHIGESHSANAGLKAACAALGGEYVVVNTERDFEEKFIAAVNRLMLPPAPTK